MLEKRWIMYGVGLMVGLLFVTLLVLGSRAESEKQDLILEDIEEISASNKEEENEKNTVKEEYQTWISIDIKGEVERPGVYKMEEGKRVNDAIKKAGGVTDEAEMNSVNLAEKVQDEMVIYVPSVEEVQTEQVEALFDKKGETKVNINEADVESLQTLPGIGPSKASSIVSYRDENGHFSDIKDLLNVSGIGEKSLEQLKDEITIR